MEWEIESHLKNIQAKEVRIKVLIILSAILKLGRLVFTKKSSVLLLFLFNNKSGKK